MKEFIQLKSFLIADVFVTHFRNAQLLYQAEI